MAKKLPKSLRKHIRLEKARIRREVLNMKEQERLIKELYKKISDNSGANKKDKNNKTKKDENKGNLQSGNKQGN